MRAGGNDGCRLPTIDERTGPSPDSYPEPTPDTRVPNETWVVLDAFRRKRNAVDYSGDVVDAEMAAFTTTHAAALLKTLRSWLQANRSDLLNKI